MDPISATIIAGLLWFFLGSAGTVAIYFIVFGISIGIAALADAEWIAGLGVVVAWVAGIVWEIFVFFQVIVHIIRLVQLVSGSPVTV